MTVGLRSGVMMKLVYKVELKGKVIETCFWDENNRLMYTRNHVTGEIIVQTPDPTEKFMMPVESPIVEDQRKIPESLKNILSCNDRLPGVHS